MPLGILIVTLAGPKLGCDPEPTCQEAQNCPIDHDGGAGHDGNGETGGSTGSAVGTSVASTTSETTSGTGGTGSGGGAGPGGASAAGSAGTPVEAGSDAVVRDAFTDRSDLGADVSAAGGRGGSGGSAGTGSGGAPGDNCPADAGFVGGNSPGSTVFFANVDGLHEIPANASKTRGIAALRCCRDEDMDGFPDLRYSLSMLLDVAGGSVSMPKADFCIGASGSNGTCFHTESLNSASSSVVTSSGIILIDPMGPAVEANLSAGNVYIDFRDAAHPNGSTRGWFRGWPGDQDIMVAGLNGANETPTNDSTAIATCVVGLPSRNYMIWRFGNSGMAQAADFCTGLLGQAPINCGYSVPINQCVNSGVGPVEAFFQADGGIRSNLYLNIRTSAYPAGEIRGWFLMP